MAVISALRCELIRKGQVLSSRPLSSPTCSLKPEQQVAVQSDTLRSVKKRQETGPQAACSDSEPAI